MGCFSDFAGQTVEKAQNTGKKYAIFLIEGKIKRTATSTDLFAIGIEKHLHCLVGVYDGECDHRWIEEDLEYMTARARTAA